MINNHVFHIPADQPFLRVLAEGIVARYGREPLVLSSITILLPNRRSARALSEAFLEVLGNKAMLLPVMRGIGDVEEEELQLQGDIDILPAIPAHERRLLLAQLVKEYQRKYHPTGIADHHALQLAIELGRFIDEVEREQLSWEQLPNIVPAELAKHWQISLGFLYDLPQRWQEEIAKRGYTDSWQRRNLLMQKQIEQWEQSPPEHPVIAAGSTGSIPATASLLKAITRLPKGMVVLPALDTGIEEPCWEMMTEEHPQFALKQLLKVIGIDRLKVPAWQGSVVDSPRGRLVREIMRPTVTIHRWQTLNEMPQESVKGFSVLEAETEEEEAQAVALRLRQVLESEGKTASLITADRALARRVAALMRRWDVEVDDSAGIPLARIPPMVFIRLIAEAVQAHFSPVEMLALFKHPLCTGGSSAGVFRSNVRALEVALLRGARVAGGLKGMVIALEEQGQSALAEWLHAIDVMAQEFLRAFEPEHTSLSVLLSSHLALAEALAETDTESGAVRLWGSEEGARAREFLLELRHSAQTFGQAETRHYTRVFEILLTGAVYRKAYGQHPALSVLSPIEARLLSFDHIILGGVNQDSWPATESNAWMSRPMAEQFGMKGAEKKIGLSAHDFYSFCHAPEVMITRASKVGGNPTTPSMWLMRLEVVLKITGLKHAVYDQHAFLEAVRELFTPKSSGFEGSLPPAPNPPLESRPTILYATHFEALMRNPYLYYARHILGIQPLDPIDSEADASDLGSLVHAILEQYTQWANAQTPATEQGAETQFLDIAREAFQIFKSRPSIHALWWPRIKAIAKWFTAYDLNARKLGYTIHAEILGSTALSTEQGRPVTLKAKADRLEVREGKTTIIDFKTGMLPTAKDIRQGFSPQLSLEALILSQEGFSALTSSVPETMIYYRLGNQNTIGEEIKAVWSEMNIQPEVVKILSAYLDQGQPYFARPFRDKSRDIKEFNHLQRVDEWITVK